MKQTISIVLAFCAVSCLQSFKVQAGEDSFQGGKQYEIQYGSDIYGGESRNYGYQDSSQQYNQQQALQDYQQLGSFDLQGYRGLDGSFTQQTDSDFSGMGKQVSQSSSLSTFQGTGQKMFGQPDQSNQQEVGYTLFGQQDQPGQQQLGYTMFAQQYQPGQQQLGYTMFAQQDQSGQHFGQEDQSSFLGMGQKPFAQKQGQSSFQGMTENQFGQEQDQQDMGQKTYGKQPGMPGMVIMKNTGQNQQSDMKSSCKQRMKMGFGMGTKLGMGTKMGMGPKIGMGPKMGMGTKIGMGTKMRMSGPTDQKIGQSIKSMKLVKVPMEGTVYQKKPK